MVSPFARMLHYTTISPTSNKERRLHPFVTWESLMATKKPPGQKITSNAGKTSSALTPEFIDGPRLFEMLQAACDGLERNQDAINSLNVFPVPDGDTGTNMLLTMKSALRECKSVSRTASNIAASAAKGALMGARGNSGVILSQIMRGLASAVEGHDSMDAKLFSDGLSAASQAAYKAVSKPVEGTMLTVIRDASEAAKRDISGSISGVMKAASQAAENAVLKTPEILPMLKEAGVVDSGGQGVAVILRSMYRCLVGDITPTAIVTASTSAISSSHNAEDGYGYCTEFLIEGHKLDTEAIRKQVMALGGSILVAGDTTLVKVHLHTSDPGKALSLSVRLGSIKGIKIDNIDSQHAEYIKAHNLKPLAVVAVALGDGFTEIFRGLGVDEIVKGGQTMNPSAEDLRQAVDRAPSTNVILLPNNPNVVMTANIVSQLSTKNVRVVPTRSIPQGIAAVLAMDPEGELTSNSSAMTSAIAKIGTLELCKATKSTSVNGIKIKKGQPIVLSEGEISFSGNDFESLICEALRKNNLKDGMLVTLYFGKDASAESTKSVMSLIRASFPSMQVELINGGQPHYEYIVSYE
ncbi:MAG: DAK2 domain-containing protein [Dehalococcoidia bacterium]|nr:DAK2 domain-containing protein [Dehalococcoidia bacterium]